MYKILMVAPRPFFINRGFAVKVYEEYSALTNSGNDVTIACYGAGRSLNGINIERAISVPWYSDPERGPSYDYVYLDLLLLLKTFLVARKIRPDVIHGHIHEGGLIGLIVGKILRIPVILDTQDFLTEAARERGMLRNRGFLRPIFYLLERFINRRVDAILSWYTFRKVKLGAEGLLKEKVFLCKECVDNERFNPAVKLDPSMYERLGIPKGSKVIGYLGLLTKLQGVEDLMDSARIMLGQSDKLHFLIMGFPGQSGLEKRLQRDGLSEHFTFTGSLDYFEAHKYLSICDVLVSPKISSTEGNGKLLNYMAMGKPIVVYDTDVNREILKDAAVYVRPGDTVSFADAVMELLRDEKKAVLLGEMARKRSMAEFSPCQMAKTIAYVYNQTLGLKKGTKFLQ
jgi:glycosyltransferase involved in cell wall biosynthesis